MFIWFLVLWNTAISLWNSYSSGQMYELADNTWLKVVAVSGGILGFVGLTYSVIMAAVALGHLGQQYLLATNVILGLPIIIFGIIITIDSIIIAYKRKSIWSVAIALYNTVSTAWNIFVWMESLKEVGGFGEAASDLADEDARLTVLVAGIAGLLISYGLFQLGRKKAREKYGDMNYTRYR